jgi:hypothetical protein
LVGPAAGEPGRGRGAPSRAGSWDAANSVLILLGLGLAFRLIIAYLLPGSGFKVDLNAFQYWASNLASQGLHGFYERPFFHDYTPGYLYVLWLVGVVGSLFGGSAGVGDLIKIPPILADLGLAWLVWSMARELGAGRRAALLGAGLVIVNPITWFDSVVWGQVDSVGVLFLLLGLRELWRDRPERSALFTMIAAITKPQLGILIPIVAAVTIRRALRPAGSYGADGPPERAGTTTRWEAQTRGWIRIVTTGLVGFFTAVVVSLPFGLSIPGLLEQVFKTAGGYPYLSVNAYNPWALITHAGRGIAATSSWVCDSFVQPTADFELRLGPWVLWHAPASTLSCLDPVYFGAIPAVAVGALLLLAAIAAVVALVAWRPDRRTMLVGLAVLCLAFFVLPTRVHERYLYPLVALGAILAAVSWRWRVAYVVSSVATFANMYAVLTTLYPDNPNISDWLGIGRTLISWPGVAAAALAQLAVFAWAAAQLRPAALRRLGEEIEDSTIEGEEGSTLDVGERTTAGAGAGHRAGRATEGAAAGTSAMAASGGRGAVAPSGETTSIDRESDLRPAERPAPPVSAVSAAVSERPRPRWDARPSYMEAGARGWLAARLWDRPIRPDRTAELDREPGGRFDRLDLWIVVVLVASLLTLRMWRLGEPYQMHFDEVYHPRTATEFLQDWRYGISHYIYEWTHPHLAKYSMALGIEAFGNDRTSATSDLGVPVAGAAIEPRWEDATDPGAHLGDRLWVATGDQVRAYDLATRALVAETDVAGATAVAVDTGLHRVFIGTATGELRIADTRPLDDARGANDAALETQAYARLDGPIERLFMPRDASVLEAVIPDTASGASGDVVVTFDPASAADIGRATLGTVAQMSEAGAGRVAVATSEGLAFLDTQSGGVSSTLALGGPVMGVAQTRDLGDDRLYASFVGQDGPRVSTIVNVDGKSTDPPKVGETFTLPGETAGWVAYDWGTMMIHVLGSTGPPSAPEQPETAPPSPTIYVVEPHANAVYEDARLPFTPTAFVIDDDQRYPSSDRQQILAFTADGAVASVETGQNAFAWRLPGVIAGVLMAALLYLLGRLLFRRREIALFLAFLSVVDGMLFVQSRIGMNDSYVGLAIVAAYTLFAAIWLRPGGTRRHWIAFAVGMPIIGLLLGLGLASKWVAAYAMGALGILVLARSALGRVILLAGLVLATTFLGYMAVSTPDNAPGGNYLFLSIMIAITLAAAIANVLHPVAWTWEEQRLATFAPGAIGVVVALAALAAGKAGNAVGLGPVKLSPLELGFAGVVATGAIHALFVVAGRWGFGPLAAPPRPGDPAALVEPAQPAPRGWLNLGSGFGIPAIWTLLCLVVLPIVVYVISYIPWAQVEGHRLWPAGSLAGFTWTAWPQGHTGQTLWELTQEMYRYHNTLSSPHAASSPWWAWPFDFKPVWFYQESFAGGTAAAIYDSGNLVAWWLGIPAMAFVTWAAFKRRSAALALVVIGFACQWLAWSRIDRAAFQYHYYTSLPFLFLGLAYFLAELWHGASRRLWLVARLAAGAAVLAPTALWLFHRPLCGFVRVTDVNPGSRACPTVIPDFVLTARAAGIAVVLGIGLLIVVTLLLSVDDEDGSRGALGGRLGSLLAPLGRFGPAAVAALGVSVAFVVASRVFEEVPLIQATNVVVEPIALVVTLALVPLAAFVATARDARRFVLGALFAMGFWFVLWYPNLAALPLPGPLSNAYQGLLPTYVYPFQFPVSTLDRNVAGPPLISFYSMALLVALAVVTVIVGYSAWVARVAEAERRAEEARLPAASGDPGGAPA